MSRGNGLEFKFKTINVIYMNNENTKEFKIFRTIEEQIRYIQEYKSIFTSQEDYNLFLERNYASIINPYKELFSSGRNHEGKHIYKKNTDLKEIINLIKIDDNYSAKLYSLIGYFEKRFKNEIFYAISLKYAFNNDINCINYVDEIKNYLDFKQNENLPIFCDNFNYQLSNEGYVLDNYLLSKKQEVLAKMYELGTGVFVGKQNKFIQHYVNSQGIAPIWVIPTELTLGELNIIFSMLDSSTQKNIINSFYKYDNLENITINKIFRFSGYIEIIRKLRNNVNHYEPLFPLIYNEISGAKKYKESQMFVVIDFLEDIYNQSFLNKSKIKAIEIEENIFNKKHLHVLNILNK